LRVVGVLVDVTETNEVEMASLAATLPMVTAEEVLTINTTIALTTGALAVLVLAMDAVAIRVNKMQEDTAPDLEAFVVSSMLSTDALLVLWDVMLLVGAGAPMETVRAPSRTPVQKDQTRSEWQMLINAGMMVEVVLRVVGVLVDVTVTNDVEMASLAATLPMATAEEVWTINRTIVLTTDALVVLVLEMGAVAMKVAEIQTDTAPAVVTVEDAVADQVKTLVVVIIFGVATAFALRVPPRLWRSPVRPSAQRRVPALWAGRWSCWSLWLGLGWIRWTWVTRHVVGMR